MSCVLNGPRTPLAEQRVLRMLSPFDAKGQLRAPMRCLVLTWPIAKHPVDVLSGVGSRSGVYTRSIIHCIRPRFHIRMATESGTALSFRLTSTSSTTMSETINPLDYEAIRNTIARYCIALDTKDFGLLDKVFAEELDAKYPFGGGFSDRNALAHAIQNRWIIPSWL